MPQRGSGEPWASVQPHCSQGNSPLKAEGCGRLCIPHHEASSGGSGSQAQCKALSQAQAEGSRGFPCGLQPSWHIPFPLPFPSYTETCHQSRTRVTHRNCSRGRRFSSTLRWAQWSCSSFHFLLIARSFPRPHTPAAHPHPARLCPGSTLPCRAEALSLRGILWVTSASPPCRHSHGRRGQSGVRRNKVVKCNAGERHELP